MGCDGGTIPRRDELVRVKKKPEAKDKDSELAFQWQCCAITQQTLQQPIVVCGLGRLYSKVSLIEALLNKELMPESIKHIRTLKDVKNLNLTPNPAFKDVDKKGDSSETLCVPYICPVIGLEMSGKFRFIALWNCGCVFSERALKEVPTKVCHKCQQHFKQEDVVVINGNEEDLVLMKSRMEERQRQMKEKKGKKIKVEATSADGKAPVETNKASTSKETLQQNGNGKVKPTKRLGAVNKLEEDSHVKKAKPDYSVAKDPNATDVYKSIFTTHKSEQEQGRAHWVTYNPFYN